MDSEPEIDDKIQRLLLLARDLDKLELALNGQMDECISVYQRMKQLMDDSKKNYYEIMKKLHD